MDPIALASLLLVGALTLVILEVFIPSGGILGFLAATSAVASVVVAFRSGPIAGLLFVVVAIIAMPAAIAIALRILPNTPIGRRLLLRPPKGDEVLPDDAKSRELMALVGKTGKAKTMMLPSGAAIIEGKTVNALSEGMAIEPGQTVRVIEVRGNRVIVRAVEGGPPSIRRDEGLDRPIDSLGLDSLEEPLA